MWPVPPSAPVPSAAAYATNRALLGRLIGTLVRPRVVNLISSEVRKAVKDGLDGRSGAAVVAADDMALETGTGAIKAAGTFRVEKIGGHLGGDGHLGRDHYCVTVEQPHPGFFAYAPLMQPLLFPIFVCCSALVRLAKAYAGRTSTWGLDEANAVVEELQKQRPLLDYMEASKARAIAAQSAQASAGDLSVIRTVETFDRSSASAQAVRRRFVDSDIVAIGKPYSEERLAQVESLMAQEVWLGTVDEMCKVREGKHMRISIER